MLSKILLFWKKGSWIASHLSQIADEREFLPHMIYKARTYIKDQSCSKNIYSESFWFHSIIWPISVTTPLLKTTFLQSHLCITVWYRIIYFRKQNYSLHLQFAGHIIAKILSKLRMTDSLQVKNYWKHSCDICFLQSRIQCRIFPWQCQSELNWLLSKSGHFFVGVNYYHCIFWWGQFVLDCGNNESISPPGHFLGK